MRSKLALKLGVRGKFMATFSRTGKKKNYQGYAEETILLNNVIDLGTGKVVTDHVWFAYTQGFQNVDLNPGVTIEFEARVREYAKGYVNSLYRINNKRTDYKLSHPTRIRIVPQRDVTE